LHLINGYNGCLDETSIWDVALSDAEVETVRQTILGNEANSGEVCTPSAETALADFVHGDKWNMAFDYDGGAHTDASDPLLDTCGSWGYAGATQMDTGHNSIRGKSPARNAVFTQPGGSTVQQQIEWYFCEPTAVLSMTASKSSRCTRATRWSEVPSSTSHV
jgi:hypothetical protein